MGAFNQEKALLGAFSVIVKTDGSFSALLQAGTRLLHWAGYMASLARAAGLRPPAPVHGHMFLYTLCLVKLRGLPFARTVRFTLSEDKASFSVTPNIFAVNILYWLGRILMYFGVIK